MTIAVCDSARLLHLWPIYVTCWSRNRFKIMDRRVDQGSVYGHFNVEFGK